MTENTNASFTRSKYFTLAVAAGVCGSLSSLFGKLCFDSDLVRSFTGNNNFYLFYGVKAFFGVLLVLSNVLMTSLFTRSLDSSDNSFKPTIINFSANFLFTVNITSRVSTFFFHFSPLFLCIRVTNQPTNQPTRESWVS